MVSLWLECWPHQKIQSDVGHKAQTKPKEQAANAQSVAPQANFPPKESEFNTVMFSGTKSMGEVLVESDDDPEFWEAVGAAQGTLQVPRNRKLQLEVVKAGEVDLAPLATLYKDLFHSVDLSESEVSDETLKFLAHQTSLQEVDLSHTAITDNGIEHLAQITSLNKLWLDKTKVTDSCISKLKEMRNLRKLSLSGTDVTESEVKKIKAEFPQECKIILPMEMRPEAKLLLGKVLLDSE